MIVGSNWDRHPGLYTDAWAWAEAIVTWREQHPERPRLLGRPVPIRDEAIRELVVAGVAESIRLVVVRFGDVIGDVDLVKLGGILKMSLRDGHGFPVPAGPEWPAPTGPHSGVWARLMDTVRTDPDGEGRSVLSTVSDVLKTLAFYAGECPHLSGMARKELWDYRLAHAGINTPTLAEVAPTLGISPAPVKSARWYQGFTGLDVVEQPA